MATVLVVDDEAEMVEALVTALQDSNPLWNILSASDENVAIEQIRRLLSQSTPVDVVVTDLKMAAADGGVRLLKEARKLDPTMMIIIYSVGDSSASRYEAYEAGAFDVIQAGSAHVQAGREISVKAQVALRYREAVMQSTTLRKYFDPKLFDSLSVDPSRLELKRKVITICFWDIREFSRLCENLKTTPHLIAEFLKEYFELAASVIFDHDGVLDKFIGDGVMALFGVFDSEGKDRENAMSAAKAAIKFRQGFGDLELKWRPIWESNTAEQVVQPGLGCGIHTAEVLVGKVGTQVRDQFTALGPPVNLASRIEARSLKGQILLSQSTAVRIRDVLRVSQAGVIDDVKNIPGTFVLYEIPR